MRILYYTSGVTGSGRVVRGISIGNALRRKGFRAEFIILSSSPFARLADVFHLRHQEIPIEPEEKLTPETYTNSVLFQTLSALKPDILLIDLLWFPLFFFIQELPCPKVFLWQTMDERFFQIPLPGGTISFLPSQFDLVIAIEPFTGPGPTCQVNPLIIRDREEILSRREALAALNLDEAKKNCLLAYNGHPGDFERLKAQYSDVERAGYRLVSTTNYHGGIFPVVDYFNAFEQIICGASYNSFWEIIYFNKNAILVPTRTVFVDTDRLIREYLHYTFKENGADQLVDILAGL